MKSFFLLRGSIAPRRALAFLQGPRPRYTQISPLRAPATGYRGFSYTRSRLSELTPPDYLDESELAIFNKLKSELQPSTLEVWSPS
jgi:hypothetical protein